jgi:hypothetical protein
LGSYYNDIGNVDAARLSFERAVEIDEKNELATLGLAAINAKETYQQAEDTLVAEGGSREEIRRMADDQAEEIKKNDAAITHAPITGVENVPI